MIGKTISHYKILEKLSKGRSEKTMIGKKKILDCLLRSAILFHKSAKNSIFMKRNEVS